MFLQVVACLTSDSAPSVRVKARHSLHTVTVERLWSEAITLVEEQHLAAAWLLAGWSRWIVCGLISSCWPSARLCLLSVPSPSPGLACVLGLRTTNKAERQCS